MRERKRKGDMLLVNSPRLSAMHYRRGFQGTCGAKDFRLNTDTVNTQLKQYKACSTRYY